LGFEETSCKSRGLRARIERRSGCIVDNGSSHAGRASIERLEGAYENLRLIHLPIHAS